MTKKKNFADRSKAANVCVRFLVFSRLDTSSERKEIHQLLSGACSVDFRFFTVCFSVFLVVHLLSFPLIRVDGTVVESFG